MSQQHSSESPEPGQPTQPDDEPRVDVLVLQELTRHSRWLSLIAGRTYSAAIFAFVTALGVAVLIVFELLSAGRPG